MDIRDLNSVIKGCRRQKRSSQKQLYQEYYAYAMSICIRYATNREEAAEILNDGFMKVYENIHKFDLSKPFKPWLRRILINTAINHYHKNLKYAHNEQLDSLSSYEIEEENILSDISYKELLAMVQSLSPRYKAVFNLYVIEGFKHEEIAEKLDISIGTSKSNLLKAKRKLREMLNKFFLIL